MKNFTALLAVIETFTSVLGMMPSSAFGDARTIEAKAISFRQSIESGEVRVVSNAKMPAGKTRITSYHIFFTGNQRRVDKQDTYNKADGNAPITSTTSSSWGTDAFRLFTTDVTPDGGKRISLIVPLESRRAKLSLDVCPDIRLVGMNLFAFPNLIHAKMNGRIGDRIDVLSVEVADEQVGGQQLHRITYQESWGTDVVWISPTQNYNVTRIERSINGKATKRLEVQLTEVPSFGWFPSRVDFVEFNESGRTTTETAEIDVIQFNKPIDSETWLFSAMGATPGQKIVNFANGNHLILGKDDITLADTRVPRTTPVDVKERKRRPVLLYMNGVLCLGLALYFVYRRLKETRGSRSATR
jgi:hypothetical protein